MEVLKTNVKGLAPVHVPFNGNPQVVTSLVGGEIQMALVPPGVAMPMVKAGKLRAISLTCGRSALVPEVPPQADAGVRDFNLEVWTELVGPARITKAALSSGEVCFGVGPCRSTLVKARLQTVIDACGESPASQA